MFTYSHVCAILLVCACCVRARWERASGSPETEVTSDCELHTVGAGSQTWDVCKSSKVFQLSRLSHPESPSTSSTDTVCRAPAINDCGLLRPGPCL